MMHDNNKSGNEFYRTRLNSIEEDFNCDEKEVRTPEQPPPKPLKSSHHVRINSAECERKKEEHEKDRRLVVVRYFLDRPGYGLSNSASRLWFHPPSVCTPEDVHSFLHQQGIALEDLLVEVYLDKFESFMLLEACSTCCVEWDFDDTTYRNPGILNVRLTDMGHAQRLDAQQQAQGTQFPNAPAPQHQQHHANTTPVGLFSFSIMVGLETTALFGKLVDGTVAESFVLAWGPYMFFVGGLLQILTGVFQVLRNNLYGAVAFMGFGSIWFANGTKLILETNFSGGEGLENVSDPWGTCFRTLYILAFSLVLLKQTFVMNKLSTTLITLLCLKLVAGAFAGWSEVLEWIQMVFGWMTSFFAFYVFTVEFTNQVYHREVFKVHKWSIKDSPEETFGAAGQGRTLFSKAALLRQASYPNVPKVRSVLPAEHSERSPMANTEHRTWPVRL